MKKQVLFLLLCSFLSSIVVAQSPNNIVPNGDFETLKSDSLIHKYLLPKEFDHQMAEWETPSHGSTDVLNSKFRYDAIPPIQNGEYAIGMIVNAYYRNSDKELTRYSEYIQCKLKEPLKAEKKYLVKFDISGSPLEKDQSQHFGMSFNHKKVVDWGTGIIKRSPQVKVNIPITSEWQTVGQIFTPKEDFQYMVFGFFDHQTELQKVRYAVDHISIVELNGSDNAITTYLDFMGEEVVLSNVHFNSNSSDLLESSFSELDKAVRWLADHPEYLIEIQGHTDNEGNIDNNLALSNRRALSVKNYLMSKGIPIYQIQEKGYGESVPIAENNTSEGKALNRRVVLKKIKLLSNEDLYKEALIFIKENKADHAFATLDRMSIIGSLPMRLLVDPDLKILHSDERWESIVEKKIFYQFEQSSSQLKNISEAFQLKLMLLENQSILQEDSIFWKNIRPIEGEFEVTKGDLVLLNNKHSQVLEKMFGTEELLPRYFTIGAKGLLAISTILLHSDDLEFQKTWLKKIEKTIEKRPEYKSLYAYLTDKIAVAEKKPQIYGSQIINGNRYPINDPKNVNKRRRKMHLPYIDLKEN